MHAGPWWLSTRVGVSCAAPGFPPGRGRGALRDSNAVRCGTRGRILTIPPRPTCGAVVTNSTKLIHRNLAFVNQVVYLSGHAFVDCTFRDCTLVMRSFDFVFSRVRIENCIWHVDLVIHDSKQWREFQDGLAHRIYRSLPRQRDSDRPQSKKPGSQGLALLQPGMPKARQDQCEQISSYPAVASETNTTQSPPQSFESGDWPRS
jgi:hypothetical protein